MRDFTHLSDTQRCMFYTICISLAEYVVFAPSSVTQHLHSVCNFTHFVKFVYCVYFSFYFYTNQACFYTQCVVLHTFFIAWLDKSWFTLFCREIHLCNLRVFRFIFYSPKTLPVWKKWHISRMFTRALFITKGCWQIGPRTVGPRSVWLRSRTV